jgi:DUF1009 family protein
MGPASHPIGIIAGGGGLPGEIAHAVVSRGGAVHIICVDGEAGDDLEVYPHTIVNWAALGSALRSLRRAKVERVLFTGTMTRKPGWLTARPDWTFFSALPSVLRLLRQGGDDALLRCLIGIFEKRGLTVMSPAEAAPELIAGLGPLAAFMPGPEDDADIAKGFALIAALGRHDIGQGAIIAKGVIEAIEGAEGTDRMIARIAAARSSAPRPATVRQPQGVLVKRAKPGQDMRVDLPAIGPLTVAGAAAAHLSGIAAMAGEVLVLDRARLISQANENNVFVAGVGEGANTRGPPARSSAHDAAAVRLLGRKAAPPVVLEDMAKAAAILADLAPFGPRPGLVVVKGRTVSIGANEAAADLIARSQRFVRKARRLGVVAAQWDDDMGEYLLTQMTGAGLAGLVVALPPGASDQNLNRLANLAARLGLFIGAVTRAGEATLHV